MAQSRVRVPADHARRRRDGVLGRDRARGHRRRADGSLIGTAADGPTAPSGRVGDWRVRMVDRVGATKHLRYGERAGREPEAGTELPPADGEG